MSGKSEKLIMLDFDSTIADSLQFFSRVLEEKLGIAPAFGDIHHTPSAVIAERLNVPVEAVNEAVDIAFRSMKFVDNVPPLPEAIKSIGQLERFGYFFRIVSARDTEEIAAPAREWLKKYNLSHIPFICVPEGETKGPYVADCILGIDDVPANLESMKDIIPHLVLMDPYGIGYKTDFHTVSSWVEFNDLVRKLI